MTKLEKVDLKRGDSLIEKVPHAELKIPGTKSARVFPDSRHGECVLYARLDPSVVTFRSMGHGPRGEHGWYKRSEFVEGDLVSPDYWGYNIRVDISCDFTAAHRDTFAVMNFIQYCTDDHWWVTHHNARIENGEEMITKWLNYLNQTMEFLIPTE